MSFVFPALTACAPVKYPLSRTVTFNTKTTRFLDDTEQRFARRYRQDVFALYLSGLNAEDVDKVEAFWEDVRGPVAPWSITLTENDYDQTSRTLSFDDVYFIGNELAWTEAELPERWSISLPARQCSWATGMTAGDPGPFPHFAWLDGDPRPFQRPITMTNRMRTAMIDHPESGLRWATALRNTALGPRLRVGLHSWKFKAQVNLSEIFHLEDHFLQCRGRLRSFPFDAPDGRTYPKCRYDQDALSIVFNAPGDVTAEVAIQELR